MDLCDNPTGCRTSPARKPAGFNAPHFAVFGGWCSETGVSELMKKLEAIMHGGAESIRIRD
jgi:hypothetical protein